MTFRPLGVRAKLAVISLALVGLAGLASGLYLEVSLRKDLEARVEAELFRHAEGLRAALVTADDEGRGVDSAEAIARAAQIRFTLIAEDGRVLADSHVERRRLPALDNHGGRPEVAAALRGERGASRRYSTTLHEDLLYAALPVEGVASARVVRAAMPAAAVEEVIGSLRLALGAAGVLALGLALFMSGLASHVVTRTLRQLVSQARALAERRAHGRIHLSSADELEHLAGSVNRIAAELEDTVQKLAAERDRFQAVLDGMGGAVIALDDERRITLANRAAQELFRLGDDPVGAALVEVLREPALLELLDEPADGARSLEFELPGKRPRRLLARASKTPVADGTVLVFHDVTEMRRLESVRKDFVANVSHELRTPVSVIRASAEALVGGGLEHKEHAERFAGAVYKNAERLSRLVSDLLDLSRIESSRYTPAVASVAVREVAERAMESLEPIAEGRRQTLSLDADESLLVQGDEGALEQVLSNLLDNAVKYTPEGGHIALRARAQGDQVRVEVEDDGPGIPDEHKARVFERFYRVDAGRSREMGGTGLGLSIVKHLVLAMGGEVGVEDRPPRGARFFVELKRAG